LNTPQLFLSHDHGPGHHHRAVGQRSALLGLLLWSALHSPLPDGVSSILIGCLLVAVAAVFAVEIKGLIGIRRSSGFSSANRWYPGIVKHSTFPDSAGWVRIYTGEQVTGTLNSIGDL